MASSKREEMSARTPQSSCVLSTAQNVTPIRLHKVSDELQRWLTSDGEKTLGTLIELFQEKSFAVLFVVLLGVPALPLPTGGATHVFEVAAVLLAAQLIAGRREIWLPTRWRRIELAGQRQTRFIAVLMRLIRRFERVSRPRLSYLFDLRLSNIFFGLLVISGSVHRAGHASRPRRSAAVARCPVQGLPDRRARGVGRRGGRRTRGCARQCRDSRSRESLLDHSPPNLIWRAAVWTLYTMSSAVIFCQVA